MRRIQSTEIQAGKAMPFKSGSFEHMMQSWREISRWAPTSSLPNLQFFGPGSLQVVGGLTNIFGTLLPGAILYDGFGQIVNVFGGGTQDLSDPGFFTLTDGSLTGPEMLIVPDQSPGIISSTPVWLVTGSFVGNSFNADPVTFSDATTHDVHNTWYIEIANAPSGAGPSYQLGVVSDLIYAWHANPSVYDIYNVQIPTINTSITTPSVATLTMGPTWSNIGGFYSVCQARKNAASFIQLTGAATTAAFGGGTTTVCTLPAGYRPTTFKQFTCPAGTSAVDGSLNKAQDVMFQVEPSGAVKALIGGTTGNVYVSLDNISFYAV